MANGHQLLRNFRKESGLTCEQMARQLDIAAPTLRSLENGTRKITAERAIEIERATQRRLTRCDLRPDLFSVGSRAN